MRTDVYALFALATRSRNLWATKGAVAWKLLRRATPADRELLAVNGSARSTMGHGVSRALCARGRLGDLVSRRRRRAQHCADRAPVARRDRRGWSDQPVRGGRRARARAVLRPARLDGVGSRMERRACRPQRAAPNNRRVGSTGNRGTLRNENRPRLAALVHGHRFSGVRDAPDGRSERRESPSWHGDSSD